ncbi:hypothetical protein V1264_014834 [Littorina saxatilis]|uniref:Macro domain-containing protein n=1 Tax=Littorina saxatilis TaxID=31220 RepID=A0AAN9BS43_9CAEN
MAEGVRVTDIEHQCTEVYLWKYFHKAKEVYYPLLNNDAVILFSSAEEANEELNRSHQTWKLQPLPHQVFDVLVAYVDIDLSNILIATQAYINNLTYIGNTRVTFNVTTKQAMLTGKSYQVEWGWNYLLSIRNNQLHIASSMQTDPSGKSATPRMTKTRPRLPDTSHPSPQQRSNPSHHVEIPPKDPGNTHFSPEAGDVSDMEFKGFSSLELVPSARGLVSSGGHGNTGSSPHARQISKEEREDHDEKKSTISVDAIPTAKTGRPSILAAKPGQDDDNEIFDKLTRHPEGEKTHPAEDRSSEFVDVSQYGDDYGADPQSSCNESDDVKAGAYGETSATSFSDDQYALQHGAFAELSRRNFDVGEELGMKLKLKMYVGDITKSQTSAIVNPTSGDLNSMAWGGVAAVIARAGGQEMELECYNLYRKLGQLAPGEVVKTKAYGRLGHLKCVIHAVGPAFVNKEQERGVYELAETIGNCLVYADEKWNLDSVAFPFVGTGMFGLSVDNCVLAVVTALLVFGYDRVLKEPGRHVTFQPKLQEVHFINTDINNVVEAILIAEDLFSIETPDSALQRIREGRRKYNHHGCALCSGGSRCQARSHGAVKEMEYYAAYGISSPHKQGAGPQGTSRQSSKETDQGHTDHLIPEEHKVDYAGGFQPDDLDPGLLVYPHPENADHVDAEFVSSPSIIKKQESPSIDGEEPRFSDRPQTKDAEEEDSDHLAGSDDTELEADEAQLGMKDEGNSSQHQSDLLADVRELDSFSDLGQTSVSRPRSGSFGETKSSSPIDGDEISPSSFRRSKSLDAYSYDCSGEEAEGPAEAEAGGTSLKETADQGEISSKGKST